MKNYRTELMVSEIEVSYRPKIAHRPQITCSTDSYEILKTCYDPNTIGYVETFIALYLNRASRVIGYKVISTGGVASTIVDAKVVFGIALKCCASSIILSHNHCSGNTNPSQADRKLTQKLVKAGELLDIFVLDHLILTPNGVYRSFADEGEI